MNTPFKCKVCETESWHPKDKQFGWCARCKKYTNKAGIYQNLSGIGIKSELSKEELMLSIETIGEKAVQIFTNGSLVANAVFSKSSSLECSVEPTNTLMGARLANSPELLGDFDVILCIESFNQENNSIEGYVRTSCNKSIM